MLVFLAGMPLVAVPQVANLLDGLFLGGVSEAPVDTALSPYPHSEGGDVGSLSNHNPIDKTLAEDAIRLAREPIAKSVTETIEALKAELVEAGVSYMVLENIDSETPTYSFKIDLPIAKGSAYTKRFEVIDDAPEQAMRRALAELRQWRIAGHTPAGLDRPTVILR